MSIHNMPEFKRETFGALKRLLAWTGVVLLGSFLLFLLGVYLIKGGRDARLALAVAVAVVAVFCWGIWGAWHLSINKRNH